MFLCVVTTEFSKVKIGIEETSGHYSYNYRIVCEFFQVTAQVWWMYSCHWHWSMSALNNFSLILWNLFSFSYSETSASLKVSDSESQNLIFICILWRFLLRLSLRWMKVVLWTITDLVFISSTQGCLCTLDSIIHTPYLTNQTVWYFDGGRFQFHLNCTYLNLYIPMTRLLYNSQVFAT